MKDVLIPDRQKRDHDKIRMGDKIMIVFIIIRVKRLRTVQRIGQLSLALVIYLFIYFNQTGGIGDLFSDFRKRGA